MRNVKIMKYITVAIILVIGVIVVGSILYRTLPSLNKSNEQIDERMASILKPNLADRTELGPKVKVLVDTNYQPIIISVMAKNPETNHNVSM